MGYYSKKVPNGKIIDKDYIQGLSTTNMFEFGSTQTSYGLDKIKQDIINLFSIRKGEHFFEPNIGSNLDDLLFEQNDFVLADLIIKNVTNDIESHLKHVQVSSVEIDQDYDNHSLKVHVTYDILSLGITDNLTLYKDIREKIRF